MASPRRCSPSPTPCCKRGRKRTRCSTASPTCCYGPAGGVASVGFHLQHCAGVIDRLFTYARGEQLTDAQRVALHGEGAPPATGGSVQDLLPVFDAAVAAAIEQLRHTDEARLVDAREVGRTRLPSTV